MIYLFAGLRNTDEVERSQKVDRFGHFGAERKRSHTQVNKHFFGLSSFNDIVNTDRQTGKAKSFSTNTTAS